MHAGEIWVLIPLAAIAASAWKAKHGYGRYRRQDDHRDVQTEADNVRLCDEVKSLKERIAVLERIATEDGPAKALDREIERLR